ncbi:TonB-dependent siderophore receptor [Brevundimonas sp. Bb-A]|uniref:TonB-dependent receptor plug domain-containing protein n=1 Tax=Brevundimonas sp. Bb-A TaxID=2560058 RepID=UPI00128F33A7|nr:TonB-dependent receptor [Brevundimonas sp. Bb-A]QFU32483.1 Colicin I receptor precursor [Brevundimonas sp. Bb-A]
MTLISGRSVLLAFASTSALMSAPCAFAQEAPPSTDDAADIGEIVVTGTRTAGRTRLDTIAPVDVITGETLTRTGTGTETAAALAAAAPSINFPRPAISDGSDHVRPATLRGLAPDQTLVLINGQRGHVGALVNVNGALGRGSTAFDLNTIPSVTLGSVEVLRDGASAQYGSDAMAGVINLRLRQAREGGGLTLNYGRYDTEYDTARGSHEATDGEQTSLSGWVGLPLGEDGFVTVSGELQKRDPTNRSDYAAPSAVVGNTSTTTVLGRFGDPAVESQSLWFNAGKPISADWEVYAFGGIQHKESESGATARAYNNANNVVAIYPNGFLPLINTEIVDRNLYGGVKGEAAGIEWDLSVGYGRNSLDYRVTNSLNASYGAGSKREFNAGGLKYDQLTLGIDGVKPLEAGLIEPLNVAFGLEYRTESFEVYAGEPASYNRGTGGTGGAGAQGFPGFAPSNEADEDRNNWSAYVDLEGRLTPALTFGVAGRYEDYSDFGDQFTGKISARYDFSPAFALRGAVSTGFHAPALQQQYFSYTATNLVTQVIGGVPTTSLIQAGTFRVDDPVALALGSKPLEPETSINYSLGAVFRSGGFELTVDAYQIEVEDRIIYSESLGTTRPSQSAATTTAVQTLLAPFGVSAARFFLNGVDTTTQGVDVVGRYRLPTDFGRFDFTLAGNYNETTVDKTPGTPAGLSIPVSPNFLFDRSNILAFEDGTPKTKVVGGLDWTLGDWAVSAKATYYASVLVANNASTLDYETGDHTLFDLEARYQFPYGVGLAVGANNLFDEYPTYTPTTLNGATGSVGFPSYSPFGFNGRFLYARLSYSF